MKNIILVLLLTFLAGCSTPNPTSHATAAAYDQVKVGMSREQVYALLGPPKKVRPAGDAEHCRVAIWGIPHDTHGWGRWRVKFNGDTVTDVGTSQAIVSGS
ncbi:MAG TPA: outer membrane protein assembly factor BamE, partial [Clostridia bacterium]|nr:outer membrane protein assembly factor BamE [Clostridia bacterium]